MSDDLKLLPPLEPKVRQTDFAALTRIVQKWSTTYHHFKVGDLVHKNYEWGIPTPSLFLVIKVEDYDLGKGNVLPDAMVYLSDGTRKHPWYLTQVVE